MKFREYEKTYEDVFLSKEAVARCDLTNVTNDMDLTMKEFSTFLRDVLRDSSDELFKIVVRFFWAQRRFFYKKWQRKKPGLNNYAVDNAFALFTRHYLGTNHRIITQAFYYGKVVSYIPDFFPDFDKNNPFKEPEKYAFPYKNITIDFLTVVYQMPERLELLKIADERNMSYSQFLDYIINYVFNYNEEHPNHFTFMYVRAFPPYVRYNLLPRNKNKIKKLFKNES